MPVAVQVCNTAPVNISEKKLLLSWTAYLVHKKSPAFSQDVDRLIHTEDSFRRAWLRLGQRIAEGKADPERQIERPAAMLRFALGTHASPAGLLCAAAYLTGCRILPPAIPGAEPSPPKRKGKQ